MDKKFKIFVSGRQKEFEKERRAIKSLITEDPMYDSMFDVFIFEDVCAKGQTPKNIYI